MVNEKPKRGRKHGRHWRERHKWAWASERPPKEEET